MPGSRTYLGFVQQASALIALACAELVLLIRIPGTNYGGADGKAAQAAILTTLQFSQFFDITNLNPLEGLGSQMMPMNVWVNPAYWPFAFFDKELATEISGIVALICYAAACYAMARCFDLPRLPSIVAAQLSIILFGPGALVLALAVPFVAIPGLAIVYVPHVVAFGLLARLSPARPQVFLIGTALFALLLYSLYCDPLWTLVSGIAWIVPFAVVTFSPLGRDTVLIRCAVLGGCVALLLLSGALEYAYALSQYTARVQFPDLLRRPPDAVFASAVVSSKYAKYFYYACVPGWAIGMPLLRGRPRTLVFAAISSTVALSVYAAAFLYLGGNWPLPLPLYLEHALFPLFWTAAVAGYWAGFKALAKHASHRMHGTDTKPISATDALLITRRLPVAARAIVAVLVACALPSVLIAAALKLPKSYGLFEGWADEPELRQFLGNNIGLSVDRQFRGSTFFYTFGYDEFLTLNNLWVDRVPTANEYSQLVTPQAIYFLHQLFKRDVAADLNWFRPWINTGGGSFSMLFRTFRALGIRYVGGYEDLHLDGMEGFRTAKFPRRPPGNPPGQWVLYEIPNVNVGNYAPSEIITARSAAEMITALAAPTIDLTRQVVLSKQISDQLVPAHDVKLSVIRGGLHISGRSDGTSLLLLPQQFSNCLRAHDARARLVRANLIMTGLIFSSAIDTDITFDYGIFSPGCRRADLTDMRQLGIALTR